MNFVTLEPSEFTKFAKSSKYKSFMQTTEIAKLREENGWTPYYFGVEENGKLRATTMLVAKPTFLGKSTFITPGGPLLDLEDTTLTEFFFKHLKSYIKSHNGYVLHIDPYYELVERDRDGRPIENGFDHNQVLRTLKNVGFTPSPGTGQPKYSFALDLNDRTPDQIFADLKRNTRNHIRKAEKMGVTIRELKREELNILKQITESTSKRRGFTDRPLSYYEQMYDLFHAKGEVKFMVAEAELGNGSTREQMVNAGLAEVTVEPKGIRSAAARGVAPAARGDGPAGRGPKVDSNSAKTPLSAAMFMLYGDEIIYLYSGSDERYMKQYNAQYAIQWYMIKFAAEHKFKRYNFYGISGLPQNGELDGIYEFKKGFAPGDSGRVIELVGAHELPTNQLFYKLHHLLSRFRH